MMDSQETVSIPIRTPDQDFSVHYPKLFTLQDFEAKYGPDNCTIMLQEQERTLYGGKVSELCAAMRSDPDTEVNVQTALDAWKPCDDRPPTEIEAMVQRLLGMPDQVQAQLYRLIEAELSKKAAEQAQVDAEKAAEQIQAAEKKFQPPADVGPPVTRPQQEPEPPASFESIGQDKDQGVANADAVEAAEAVQEADIEASGEDLKAAPAFEEGGSEGVIVEEPAQTEVGMPPPPTE